MENRAKSLSHIGKRSVLLSVIALFEIAALVVVACFSWIEHGPAELNANEFVIMSGSGFNFFNEDGDAVDVLQIRAGGKLSDCSTVDGRRLYFPVLGEENPEATAPNTVKNGKGLTYRAATEVDQNYYTTVDFQVISIAENDIDVYVDPAKSYVQYYSNSEAKYIDLKAARITFNQNDGTDPVTVCPGTENRTNKKLQINSDTKMAVPSAAEVTYKAMNKNGGKDDTIKPDDNIRVFTLPRSKVKTISMTVWLDGFDATCTDSIVNLKQTKLQIRFGVRDNQKSSNT